MTKQVDNVDSKIGMLAKILKASMKKADLSQRELAKMASVPISTLNRYTLGHSTQLPSDKFLDSLTKHIYKAKALDSNGNIVLSDEPYESREDLLDDLNGVFEQEIWDDQAMIEALRNLVWGEISDRHISFKTFAGILMINENILQALLNKGTLIESSAVSKEEVVRSIAKGLHHPITKKQFNYSELLDYCAAVAGNF